MKRSWMVLMLTVLSVFLLTGCQESDKSKYERAQSLMAKGSYSEAADVFDKLGSYEESTRLSMYCKAAAAGESGDFDTAFSTFTLLGDYKESQFMIIYYQARQYEQTVESGTWINWRNWISAANLYDTLVVFRDSKDRAESCRKSAYNHAVKMAEGGDYETAITILDSLGTYSDSVQLRQYYNAFQIEGTGDYSRASNLFSSLGTYKDSDKQITLVLQRGYEVAEKLESLGEQQSAIEVFNNLGDYSDSQNRISKIYYDQGVDHRNNQEWDLAVQLFTQAEGYNDASTQILETRYQEANGFALGVDGDDGKLLVAFVLVQPSAEALKLPTVGDGRADEFHAGLGKFDPRLREAYGRILPDLRGGLHKFSGFVHDHLLCSLHLSFLLNLVR